jgi:hypothetical protein
MKAIFANGQTIQIDSAHVIKQKDSRIELAIFIIGDTDAATFDQLSELFANKEATIKIVIANDSGSYSEEFDNYTKSSITKKIMESGPSYDIRLAQ